jgi:hypothetical protein
MQRASECARGWAQAPLRSLVAPGPIPSRTRWRAAALSSGGSARPPIGRGLAVALALAVGCVPAVAAQRVIELGVQAIGTAADPAVAVGGVYGAIRISRRTRISATLGAGVSDGDAAFRGELLAHFLLNPTRRAGAGLYGAGGIAVAEGAVDQGYLVVTLGIEGRPGARSGWFLEGGVGGGARLAVGYRWRRATLEQGEE